MGYLNLPLLFIKYLNTLIINSDTINKNKNKTTYSNFNVVTIIILIDLMFACFQSTRLSGQIFIWQINMSREIACHLLCVGWLML